MEKDIKWCCQPEGYHRRLVLTTGGECSVGEVCQEHVEGDGGQVSRIRKASHQGHGTHRPVTAQFSCEIRMLGKMWLLRCYQVPRAATS